MNLLILSAILVIALGLLFTKPIFREKEPGKKLFLASAAAALALRLIFAYLYFGHNTDVNDFLAWSDMLFKNGLPSFYTSGGFTDYPPGYMYILWIIGFIKNTFSISGRVLVKLPAIAADTAIAFILYKYLKKRGLNTVLAVLFLFNPASIINSSLWGQTDSVFTLFIILSLIALTEKNTLRAYFFFALSVFIKPQSCMFAPLYIYFFAESVMSDKKALKTHLVGMGISAAAVFVLCLPFGIKNTVSQYISTLSSYPYATVNAFNVWAALGLNWHELTPAISAAGAAFIAAITLASFYLLRRLKSETKYFFTGVFICLSVFMLSVKMHERYAYPAMILAAFCIDRDLRKYILYLLITASQFFNTAFILFIYEASPSDFYNAPIVIAASIINIGIFLYMTYISDGAEKAYIPKKDIILPEKTASFGRLSKADIFAMLIITALYSCAAFSNLGSLSSPKTNEVFEDSEITLHFDNEESVEAVRFYLGAYPLSEDRTITVKAGSREEVCSDADVFSLNDISLGGVNADTVTLSFSGKISLNELSVINTEGTAINISNADKFPQLFDEEIPQMRTYLNSTYFDEIYHARTAYEFIHKLPVYEWTHPPLGKIFISFGIRLFGMTPFGWRCVGVLFGIMMLPVIYITAKLFFKETWLCSVTTLIFAFDFMHYVQSRLATIDVYVTFFIMLMYLYMFIYASKSFYDHPLKKTLIPLLLCGYSAGRAIACKWTGVYAAAGIAVIFFITLARRFREYSQNKNLNFYKNASLTLIFCIFCFIIIPIGLYCLSYIPYLAANGEGISGIWKNQLDIFTYHAKTVVSSTHPYASKWYTWPLMLKPIWYYSAEFPDGKEAGISAFGNPLVWWAGIAACIFCIVRAVKYKDKKAIWLLTAYAANFLPWAPVERTMFIYHYFPSVPFVVLMIGYSISFMYQKNHKVTYAAYAYTLCVILLFALFYPVLTGTPVNPIFVKSFLRWLPGWVLIK